MLISLSILFSPIHTWSTRKDETVTMFEKIISFLIRSFTSSLNFGRIVYVNLTIETMFAIFIVITVMVLVRIFRRGRPLTQNSTNQTEHSVTNPTSVVFNSVQLGSERSGKTLFSETRDRSSLKCPQEFKDGMDVKAWFTVLEIYLKCFTKAEWLETTICFVDNKVLKKFKNLELWL